MSREIIEYLKLFHGIFNTFIMMLVLYQGKLGLNIRKSEGRPAHIVKRHRKTGPVAVALGVAGFSAGMIITFLDRGRIFAYPLHFLNGLLIVLLLMTTYLISKKIKGTERYWRSRHYAVGIVIILLYLVQVFLGLGVLL